MLASGAGGVRPRRRDRRRCRCPRRASCPGDCHRALASRATRVAPTRRRNPVLNSPRRQDRGLHRPAREAAAEQIEFFGALFGERPRCACRSSARARTARSARCGSWRQSEVFELNDYFGSSPRSSSRRRCPSPRATSSRSPCRPGRRSSPSGLGRRNNWWRASRAKGGATTTSQRRRGPDEGQVESSHFGCNYGRAGCSTPPRSFRIREPPAALRLEPIRWPFSARKRLRGGACGALPSRRVHGGMDFHGRVPRFRRGAAHRMADLVPAPARRRR